MYNVICYFLCFFVEAVIALQYASHLFVPEKTLGFRIGMVGIFYSILFAVSLMDVKWLNMSLYLLANYFFLVCCYRIKYSSAVFHSMILAAVMSMCELIVYNVIERFTPHFFVQAEKFHNKILFIVFSKLLFFVVIFVLIYFLKGQQKYTPQKDYSVLMLICVPAMTVFVMLTLVSISDICTLTPLMNGMVSLSALFLLSANLLIFGVNHYNQKKNMEYTDMQLLLEREKDSVEYYKMLAMQNENQSILIHDIKKHLQSIKLLNEKGENSRIGDYIQQLVNSSDLKEIPRICDNELLNVILSRYKRQCSEKRITFLNDIRCGTTNFIADNELTSLFCNLLDNAIEAAETVSEPYVEVSSCKREKTPFIVITVINSCGKTPFSGSAGKLRTTKPDRQKHGFGIKSIRKIISKYHGDVQMYYNEDTLTFHTIITLKHEN